MSNDNFKFVQINMKRFLYIHLKPEMLKNLDEMAKEADLFAEGQGGVHM